MSDRYEEVLKAVRFLTLEEQQKLLEDIQEIISARLEGRPYMRITDLEGLGAEIWEGVDVEEYINQERNSWEPLPEKKYSVTEFRGMAKDLWKDVDVKAYIREERNSWDKEDDKD